MVNPLELLQAQVDKANYLLKKKKVGATVYIRKDGFFLRAYLPSKVKPNWTEKVVVPLSFEVVTSLIDIEDM